MKRMLLVPALALPLAAQAQNAITISGEAEIKVVPGRVNILLGVETRSLDLAAARRQNDNLVKAVLAVPAAFGVSKEDVQTDFMELGVEYQIDGLTVKYYSVRKSVNILLRDVTKFEAIVAAAVDAGATHVHSVEFSTSELRKHRDAARALAVKAATEKAHALASAAGRKPGAVKSISESYGGGSWYGWGWGRGGRMQMQNVVQIASGGRGGDAGATVALGRISVTASVQMSFELE